jgi:beta-glucanase (GH16 family)
LNWVDADVANLAFDAPIDASGSDAVTFWYRGDGSGRDVALRLADGGTEPGPWITSREDTFDGPAGSPPDPSIWTPEIGDGTAQGIPGWGNAELQTYTDDPANASLDGHGRLAIVAREAGADAPMCSYGRCRYTSARLVTRDAVEVQYGRIEARIQIPFGRGIWSAFWLLGGNVDTVPWPDSGEIDVMENVGHERSTVHGTVHGPGYSGGNGIGRPYRLTRNENFSDAFHTFAIEWEPGELRWYVDDVLYSTVDDGDLPRGSAWVYDHPFFMILNVAVGGNWPGAPDASTTFPQTMLVDHVRVSTRADVAERFEATFVDDVAGWRRVTLPLSTFVRANAQPDGAVDDGLGLLRLEGIEVVLPAGGGVAWIDEVRLIRP